VAKTFHHQLFAQSNVSLCGPASLANVFRSLSEAATTESGVLAGTARCWTGFCVQGLTLDELADVARAHTYRKVTVLQDLTADEFRDHPRRSNDTSRRYVINFRRREIFGAGVGHFSPIAGYFENEDLVFVLDVNENFRPWLIERSRLFAAMSTLDGDKKRREKAKAEANRLGADIGSIGSGRYSGWDRRFCRRHFPKLILGRSYATNSTSTSMVTTPSRIYLS